MLNTPKTLEEAKAYKYTKWSANLIGNPYNESFCAYEVWPQTTSCFPYQCSRKNGHGPAGLYCKQHAKMVDPT